MNVLAIGCHPDDVEIACAGTLAKCVKRGDKVIVCHVSSGNLGHAEGYTIVPSYALPDGYIKGTTGAGDAFCAGTLIGIYKGWQDREILEFASACAVMALGTADATGGLVPEAEIRAYCAGLERRQDV